MRLLQNDTVQGRTESSCRTVSSRFRPLRVPLPADGVTRRDVTASQRCNSATSRLLIQIRRALAAASHISGMESPRTICAGRPLWSLVRPWKYPGYGKLTQMCPQRGGARGHRRLDPRSRVAAVRAGTQRERNRRKGTVETDGGRLEASQWCSPRGSSSREFS